MKIFGKLCYVIGIAVAIGIGSNARVTQDSGVYGSSEQPNCTAPLKYSSCVKDTSLPGTCSASHYEYDGTLPKYAIRSSDYQTTRYCASPCSEWWDYSYSSNCNSQ